jgi:type II secretory pathway component PulJ
MKGFVVFLVLVAVAIVALLAFDNWLISDSATHVIQVHTSAAQGPK